MSIVRFLSTNQSANLLKSLRKLSCLCMSGTYECISLQGSMKSYRVLF